MYTIWKSQTAPQSITLNDEDFTSLALALSLRNNNNNDLLQEQLTRIKNPDRINRFKIIMKAASSDKKIRDEFLIVLQKGKTDPTNRLSVLH